MLSTSFNQVFFCIIRSLIFIPHVNLIQQLCLSCHRLLPLRSSPGEPTSVCLAFHLSVCLCVARCPVFHVICHTWCSCASPDLWSRAAERPPVAAARLVSLCTQRAPRQNAGMTRESFLAELQDRQTKERTAASGLQWWLLLHRLLLRSLLSRFDAYRQ